MPAEEYESVNVGIGRRQSKILTKAKLGKIGAVNPVEDITAEDLKNTSIRTYQSFLTRRSLNFDILRTKVYIDRKKGKCTHVMEWIAYGLVGALMGFTAACMT